MIRIIYLCNTALRDGSKKKNNYFIQSVVEASPIFNIASRTGFPALFVSYTHGYTLENRLKKIWALIG